jgi:hypothetical protein
MQENQTRLLEAMRDSKTRTRAILEWKLESDAEYLREALVKRARTLAERLTRVAEGLAADPEFSFNTLGELQGNGVDRDTLCPAGPGARHADAGAPGFRGRGAGGGGLAADSGRASRESNAPSGASLVVAQNR